MEPIVVKRKGSLDTPLFEREQLSTVIQGVQNCKLLGEDTVTLTVDSVAAREYKIGDTLEVYGSIYTLNQLPKTGKFSDRRFTFDLVFEGPQYSLLRGIFLNQDASGFGTGSDFSLTGNLELFARVLLTNIQRLKVGSWALGDIPASDTLTLSFNGENCLSVLQRICQEFGTEFTIIRESGAAVDSVHKLHFGKQGEVLGHVFEYGRGRGLYALSRENVQNEAFITRLYAYGSTKNIPSNYRGYSSRLKLDDSFSFLENEQGKAAFGIIEGQHIWEEIYPKRTGTLSGVGPIANGAKTFVVSDTSMDFNLLEESGPAQTVNGKSVKQYRYLLPGVTPKLHFNTGSLAGYEFEISQYDPTTRTFTLIVFQDERGMLVPNTSVAFQPAPGDTYVLLDILMPDNYVKAAEAELLAMATAYLGERSTPRVQYNLAIDEQFLKSSSGTGSIPNFFALGDYVQILDADLGINGASRIIGFTRDLLNPYRYTLEIADTYQVSLIERILSEQAAVQTIVKINQLSDANRARQGWRTVQEALSMVFDTDDYFQSENIRPESIETSMLVVGAKSQQFTLNCVIEPNYQGQPNVVRVNAGGLTHYTVEEAIRTWQFGTQTITITSDTARYIYARCSKASNSDASILFSTAQIKPNDEATYYNFLLGILHSKDSSTNVRWISLTYGATAINGRFIKTGRIQSFDGLTYFDLDLGEIGGKITFIATDGSSRPITELTKTTIDGGIITSGSILLAGVGGQVRAGITGEGTGDSSVRFWAGATYTNRALAPFRVLQSGELFARKRIELMNENNVGQAGISGSNTTADGKVRFWAGSPYSQRNTAPFRVLSDGQMISTSGKIGQWTITGDGIVNEDGQAYIITRTSTNPHRTEARIGANVFPATFGGKGAAMFVANEADPLAPNYAGVFEAANGIENYAIYALTGVSLFGEALLNGRRYFGQELTNVTLIADPSLYDFIEIFPQGTSAGLKFSQPSRPIKNGKEVIILNSNDTTSALIMQDIIRGIPTYSLPGGNVLTLIFSNGFWYGRAQHDNNYGPSSPPFQAIPPNPAPVTTGSIPSFTTIDRNSNTYTIPNGVFTDTEALSLFVDGYLPGGVTFKGGPRTFYLDESVQNGSYFIAVRATDSAGQSVMANFTLIVNWPPLNPPPVLANPIGNITLTGSGSKTIEIPSDTFTDTDTLTLIAMLQSGNPLPDGVEFTGTAILLSANLSSVVLPIRIQATDTAGQLVNADFTVTLTRSTGNDTVVDASNDDYVPPVGNNQNPVLKTTIPNQTGQQSVAFSYVIPADTFTDPDGTISGYGVTGLPSGLSYAPSTRVISGTPAQAGTFTILVTATDNAGATAQTSFTLTISASSGQTFVEANNQDYTA